jgi:hypothetical protein
VRIRTTMGPSASPPPDLHKGSNDQQNYPPRRIDADSPGVSAPDRPAGSTPQVPVQLTADDRGDMARRQSVRADTLPEATVKRWRAPSRATVHLPMIGLRPGGVPIPAYPRPIPTRHGFGADRAPHPTDTIPLAVLRHLGIAGEVSA